MKFFSVGISMSWQIAAGTAASLKSECIEKEHIFIGLFSMEKLVELGRERFGLTPSSWRSLINEQIILENLLTRYGIDSAEIRRRVRAHLSPGTFDDHDGIVHRSHECILIFKQAEQLAREGGGTTFACMHLLAAVLKNPGEAITAALDESDIVPRLFRQHVINMAGKRQVGFTRLDGSDFDTMHMFASSTGSAELVTVVDDIVVAPELSDLLEEAAYGQLLVRHDEIVTAIVRRYRSGEVIKSTGSGLLMVFTSLQNAISSVLQLQETFKNVESFKIRIGMDMGAVLREKQQETVEIYGTAVDNAYRLSQLSAGGHIFSTETIYEKAISLQIPFSAWYCTGTRRVDEDNPPLVIYEVYDFRSTRPLTCFFNQRIDSDLAALEKNLDSM
ncbi:MAG: hypothetical protein QGH40_00890 [bacterium]|jgi:class 3 adenylate cyclase|nr:hypothetical protein [bacterium]